MCFRCCCFAAILLFRFHPLSLALFLAVPLSTFFFCFCFYFVVGNGTHPYLYINLYKSKIYVLHKFFRYHRFRPPLKTTTRIVGGIHKERKTKLALLTHSRERERVKRVKQTTSKSKSIKKYWEYFRAHSTSKRKMPQIKWAK